MSLSAHPTALVGSAGIGAVTIPPSPAAPLSFEVGIADGHRPPPRGERAANPATAGTPPKVLTGDVKHRASEAEAAETFLNRADNHQTMEHRPPSAP